MNNQENTQATVLRNQLSKKKKIPELTQEMLKRDLTNPKLHGKKVDLPIKWISTSDNHRTTLEDISSLKMQIKEIGLAQPIGIQLLENKITVVYGHRRLKAFQELQKDDPRKFSKISCIIQVYDNQNQGRIITQAIENLGRSELKPLDECKAINELKCTLKNKNGGSYNNQTLGEFLGGLHRKTVDLAIIIANWPERVHNIIRKNEDKFTISDLRSLAKKGLKEEDLIGVLNAKKDQNENKKNKTNSTKNFGLKGLETKSFKEYIYSNESSLSDELKDFVFKQRKWLGSIEHRKAMKNILSQYFKEG